VALGGYGRRELAPGSDVDLLVLREAGRDAAAVEAFVRGLWDDGLEVGHAVRDLAGVDRALRRDLHAATALLEGRRVAGPAAGFAQLRGRVEAFLATGRTRFARAKLAEAAERHAARGPSVCLLAPDLKAGRGTLRDLQLLVLCGALFGAAPAPAPDAGDLVVPGRAGGLAAAGPWLELEPGEVEALERARALLLACRTALHEAAPEAGDRLDPRAQRLLATRLGYTDREERLAVEVFMDAVYRSARDVDRAVTRCRVTLEPADSGEAGLFLARPLAAGVVAAGDHVELEPPGEEGAEPGPRAVMELFRQAQRTHRRIGFRTLDRVRRLLGPELRQALRADEGVTRVFLEVLGGTQGVAAVVRAMHEGGVLGALLPEWEAMTCLAQADAYHEFTVDEHTLAGLDALEGDGPRGAVAREDREATIRTELLHQTPRRHLLRLGLLLHDAGKVSGALGHVERGAAMVRPVAARLGLAVEEERHVRFLVREHLTLSRLAEKRDVDAPETVEELLGVVRRSRERLDHLYLLTCADVQGVSPRALTRWKDYLITRLYESARDALEAGGHEPAVGPTSPAAWEGLLAPRVRDPAALRRHLARCSRDYLADVHPEEVLTHLDLVERLEGGAPGAVTCSLDVGCTRVWVVARDRPGLFADLCGALTGAGCEILAVGTFGRDDGVVFDRFAVARGREPVPHERWGEVERAVLAVVDGDRRPESLIAARVRREGPERPGPPPPPVRIRITNDASPTHTIIDVSAPDRVGLLFDLARALAEAECDIRLAKVATKGDRAVDVFHVTGPDGRHLDAARRERVTGLLGRAARRGDPEG